MVLTSGRLRLEPWQSADWTLFRPIAQDPEVMRYITGGIPWTEEQIRNFVDRQIQLYAERGFCRWKALDVSSGELAGFCGVGFWRDGLDPEIGWWLARRFWGRGLATEAAHCALHDALDRVGLRRIISVAMVENTASRRIMEKLGLRPEREFQSDGFQLVQYALDRIRPPALSRGDAL